MFKPSRPILLSLAAALALTPPLLTRAAAAVSLAQPVSEGDLKKLIAPAIIPGAQELNTVTMEVGKTITIRGYIPKGPLPADRAEFTLTPSPAESSPACVVRIADAGGAGKTMTGTLDGKAGLRPGAEVFVTGRVESAADGKPLSLVATSMHIPRSPLPADTFTDQPAPAAKDISEARKAGGFKVGDEVVLRGRVGGSKDPFVAGRAMFTLVGRGLKACNENADDKCRRPWDYCCETKEAILANSVSVQFVDDKGQVLRTDMKGRRGLAELSDVVIVGKVAAADRKAVVVNATKIAILQ